MPLVKCPDCGREVSTGASHCPGCGLDNPGVVAAEQFQQSLGSARIRATTRASFEGFFVGLASALVLALVGKVIGTPAEEIAPMGVVPGFVFFAIRRSRLIKQHLSGSRRAG